MRVAVYGTLRKGDYNYDRFMQGAEPISVERIKGFEMYNLGGNYPYIARGGDDITVEVYDLDDSVFARIESMERGAGYEVCKVKTSVGIASIFHMDEKSHARMQSGTRSIPPKIVSGDWFEWLRKYKSNRLELKGENSAVYFF